MSHKPILWLYISLSYHLTLSVWIAQHYILFPFLSFFLLGTTNNNRRRFTYIIFISKHLPFSTYVRCRANTKHVISDNKTLRSQVNRRKIPPPWQLERRWHLWLSSLIRIEALHLNIFLFLNSMTMLTTMPRMITLTLKNGWLHSFNSNCINNNCILIMANLSSSILPSWKPSLQFMNYLEINSRSITTTTPQLLLLLTVALFCCTSAMNVATQQRR